MFDTFNQSLEMMFCGFLPTLALGYSKETFAGQPKSVKFAANTVYALFIFAAALHIIVGIIKAIGV